MPGVGLPDYTTLYRFLKRLEDTIDAALGEAVRRLVFANPGSTLPYSRLSGQVTRSQNAHFARFSAPPRTF